MTASDADLNHLFGIKKPFLSPLYLSHALPIARPITTDEAAQICERDSAIKPTTRGNWELAPLRIGGVLHAELRKMTKRGGDWHPEATWHLPVAPEVGMLRLSLPLGSGRALTKNECRQLRCCDEVFAHANPAWSIKPFGDLTVVEVVRDVRSRMQIVGTIPLVPGTPVLSQPQAKPPRVGRLPLSPRYTALLSSVF